MSEQEKLQEVLNIVERLNKRIDFEKAQRRKIIRVKKSINWFKLFR